MIGTSGLLNIDTGKGYATGFDTMTFGKRERASGGSGGTFKIEDFMHGYTDRSDKFVGNTGRYEVGAYQSGRGTSGRTTNIDSPSMDTELINISTRPIGDRIIDPLNIRKMMKKNRLTSTIASVVGNVKNMFRGRKLLRRTRL